MSFIPNAALPLNRQLNKMSVLMSRRRNSS